MATRLFWHLFTKPRPRKFTQADEEFYAGSISSQMESQKFGLPFTVHKRGSGDKKVLLLHGWEGRASDFSRMITNIENELSIYTIDFPGHGKSPKSRAHLPIFIDVIQTALNTLGSFEAVIGHSLGAASLAMAAGKNQHDVNKLIFLGLHPVPSQYFVQYKTVTKVNNKVFDRCVRMAEAKTDAKLLEYSCYNYLENYANYSVHFIHDSKDKIIHVKRVEELAENLPESAVFQGDHGGHFRHYKHQEVVAKIKQIILEK